MLGHHWDNRSLLVLTAFTGVGFGLALPHFSYQPLELRTVISIQGGEDKRSQNLWNRLCLVLLLLCWCIFAGALVHGSGSYLVLQTSVSCCHAQLTPAPFSNHTFTLSSCKPFSPVTQVIETISRGSLFLGKDRLLVI